MRNGQEEGHTEPHSTQGKSNKVALERFDIILPESAFFGKQNLREGDACLFRVDRVYYSW